MTPEAITAGYEKFIEAEERRTFGGVRNNVYASAWTACTRQMALDMLRPDVKPAFKADTLANFRRGKDRERDLVSDLVRVGRHCEPAFEIVGGQERFELRDRKGRVAISGKVDMRLKFAGQKGSDPAEIKSFHPSLIQGIKEFSDMFRNRWTRRGAFQLLSYMLGHNEERGWLFLDRPGIPRPLVVNLYDWMDKIEDFLNRAEIAMDAREKIVASGFPPEHEMAELGAGSFWNYYLPPYIDNPAECRVCPFFGSACNPPLKFDAASIITDESEIQRVERYADLDAMPEMAEYNSLDTWIKKRFRGMKQVIAGKCVISGHWQKDTKTNLPEDVKKQIAEIAAPYKKTVEEGKWIQTVEKVVE